MVVEAVFGGSEAECGNLLEVLLELLSTREGIPILTTFNQGVDQILFLFQLVVFLLAKVGEQLH